LPPRAGARRAAAHSIGELDVTTKSRPPAKHKDRYLNKLTPEHKVFVVKRLATYDTPTAIVRDLKALFGVEVTLQAIDHYLPHKASEKRLACWQELFWETRKAFIAACAEAGTMHEMVRVRLREDMVLLARDAGHYRTANELLDSIAKEAGKMFVNRYHSSWPPLPNQHPWG
jgi:hypothetical protein